MNRVFLFGEAERGDFCRPMRLRGVEDLMENLGHPPEESMGIDYAIQTLLCKRELIFYRVREEGFSHDDYKKGARLLANHGSEMKLSAICMPGMGDQRIINSLSPICQAMNALILVSERDFYDYLTGSKY